MKKYKEEIISLVILAIVIVAMYYITMGITYKFGNSIIVYIITMIVILLVILLMTYIIKNHLFKGQKYNSLLKLLDILNELAELLVFILLYYGIVAEKLYYKEQIFLAIVCVKLFYISMSIIESKVFKKIFKC